MEDYLKPSFTNFELDSEILLSKLKVNNPNLDDLEKRIYVFLAEYLSVARNLVLNDGPEATFLIF